MNSTLEKDLKRRSREELVAALLAARAEVKGNAVKCPFHEDHHASGSIFVGEDGAWRFKCHACQFHGDVFDVISRSGGKPVAELLRELSKPPTRTSSVKPPRVFPTIEAVADALSAYNAVEAVHRYTDPDTKKIALVVFRTKDGSGRKNFVQYRPVDGGFSAGAPEKPWPLYNRTRLRSAEVVIVVEGEKCVEALAAIGVVATTSPCGAGKADHADWTPLAGKTVYLWPDADMPDPKTGKRTGIEHMKEVATKLEELNPAVSLFWIDPYVLGLPDKGDVVDFLDGVSSLETDKAEAIWHVVREVSEPMGAASEVGQLIEAMICGEWKAIEWPHRQLGNLSKALFPGTITTICGDPSASKSYMVLESFLHWHEQSIPVALFELEDSRRDHLHRSLAQMSGVGDVRDDVWNVQNPERAREIFAEYSSRLNSFGRVITSAGEKQPTVADLAAWVEEKCAAGVKIIGIDPITFAAYSDKPWKDDKEFFWRVGGALRRSGSRLILVTHPRKGGSIAKGGSAMDDMAGGAAFPRHSQNVFWFSAKCPPETMTVKTCGGNYLAPVNRIIQIAKARNGKGSGAWIGYFFNPDTLRFEEQGVLTKEAPTGGNIPRKAPRVAKIVDPFADEREILDGI